MTFDIEGNEIARIAGTGTGSQAEGAPAEADTEVIPHISPTWGTDDIDRLRDRTYSALGAHAEELAKLNATLNHETARIDSCVEHIGRAEAAEKETAGKLMALEEAIAQQRTDFSRVEERMIVQDQKSDVMYKDIGYLVRDSDKMFKYLNYMLVLFLSLLGVTFMTLLVIMGLI